jgi:hypothetical protein
MRVLSATLVGASLIGSGLHGSVGIEPAVFGSNVQASVALADSAHYELWACADTSRPGTLVVASMVYRNGGMPSVVAYGSTDSGRSWSIIKESPAGALAADPSCTFGSDHRLYLMTLITPAGETRADTVLDISEDLGRTWQASQKLPYVDRPYILSGKLDGRETLLYHGTIYRRPLNDSPADGSTSGAGGNGATALAVFRGVAGAPFTGPTERIALGSTYLAGNGNSVLTSDGTFVSVFGLLPDRRAAVGQPVAQSSLKAIRYRGGALETPVTVSDWVVDAVSSGSALPVIAIDANSSKYHGSLYVVRIDKRRERAAVVVSRSLDGGRSWSNGVWVDDDRAETAVQPMPDSTNPSIAVNDQGVVAVGWADRREHADNHGWRYRVALSVDGGQTFSPSIPIASGVNAYDGRQRIELVTGIPLLEGTNGSPHRLQVVTNGFYFSGGHTVAMVADANGNFHPFWVDNRTGVSQVWTATVPSSAAPAATSLPHDSLHDISDNVRSSVVSTTLDRKTNSVAVEVELKNTGTMTFTSPLVIRVLSQRSALGSLSLSTLDSEGEDVRIRLQDQLRSKEWRPNQAVRQTLRFDLKPSHVPVEPPADLRRPVVDLTFRVYGTAGENTASGTDASRP